MRIYFIRHGESHANLLRQISNRGLCHGLTRTGRQQAHSLALKLEPCSITKIYASPVLRAIETCVILANQLDVDYELTDALREYDCGVLEGRADPAAWQGWQELYDAWVKYGLYDQRVEGGESFADIRARFVPFIERLVERHAGESVVCVSHGGIYTMMLPMVLGNVSLEMTIRYGFDYAAYILAESRPDKPGLVCLDWNGLSLPEEPGSVV